jgi:hypothetical protein
VTRLWVFQLCRSLRPPGGSTATAAGWTWLARDDNMLPGRPAPAKGRPRGRSAIKSGNKSGPRLVLRARAPLPRQAYTASAGDSARPAPCGRGAEPTPVLPLRARMYDARPVRLRCRANRRRRGISESRACRYRVSSAEPQKNKPFLLVSSRGIC